MKVILLQDVKALGKKGDIVEINEGYARNFILPKKLGLEANNKNLNDLKLANKRAEKKAQEELEEAKALAVRVEEKPVVTHIRTGEGGRTFGTVSSKEIAAAAKQQLGLELDKKKISLPEALKNLGTYEVSVKLHKDVTATLRVKVEAE
ncbi:MAG: 50S ribosomal protein L9 [Lachnospiraceae bacterium]